MVECRCTGPPECWACFHGGIARLLFDTDICRIDANTLASFRRESGRECVGCLRSRSLWRCYYLESRISCSSSSCCCSCLCWHQHRRPALLGWGGMLVYVYFAPDPDDAVRQALCDGSAGLQNLPSGRLVCSVGCIRCGNSGWRNVVPLAWRRKPSASGHNRLLCDWAGCCGGCDAVKGSGEGQGLAGITALPLHTTSHGTPTPHHLSLRPWCPPRAHIGT